ncbi:MAG: acetyl esterase [Brooklawnia sp.]|nr:acetyl esterase [Brooklawnia sp.]
MNKFDVPAMWTRQMGEVVAKSTELAADAYDTSAGLAALRAGYRAERKFWNEGGPELARVHDAKVPTEFGDVGVRAYYPVAEPDLPCIVFIHGGGYVLGSPETHDRITRILADRTGAAVVSVDYTLSPEAKHPQAMRECVAVIQELQKRPDRWGIDGSDISLAGDSGGAFMSLSAHLYLRDELNSLIDFRCLLLFYGFFGLRDSMSWRLLGGPWDGLTAEDYRYYLEMFLTSPEQIHDPYVDLFSHDLTRDMPPCYIAAADLDPLRDDSRCLAAILANSGLPHRYEQFSGVIHAFLHNSRMLDEANDALQHAATFFHDHAK